MELLVPALIAVFIMGIFIRMAVAPSGKATSIESRLSSFAERPRSLEELELELPFRERIVRPFVNGLVKFLGRFTPAQNTERSRNNLAMAGNPNNMGV